MVIRASSQGKEIVIKEDISKMPITFILNLLKCIFLGPHQTLYKTPWRFLCAGKFKNHQVRIFQKQHYINSSCPLIIHKIIICISTPMTLEMEENSIAVFNELQRCDEKPERPSEVKKSEVPLQYGGTRGHPSQLPGPKQSYLSSKTWD